MKKIFIILITALLVSPNVYADKLLKDGFQYYNPTILKYIESRIY